jgi:hypothetical protein
MQADVSPYSEPLNRSTFIEADALSPWKPKKSSLQLSSTYEASGHPYFEYRIGGISHWRKEIAQEWHPVLRFGTSTGLRSNHSMENWHALYGESHPEYFGLREDGTRAITAERVSSGQNKSYNCFSEPGVLKQHLDNVDDYYKIENFGNARFMHMTDCHAQLLPVHFREPSVNLGFHSNFGKPPHIVGNHFLKNYGITPDSRAAFAMSSVNYVENAQRFHKVGGFAHIKTMTDHLRASFGANKTLFLLSLKFFIL